MDDMEFGLDQIPLEEELEAVPEAQPEAQPQKSKRGLILAIGIPVLAVLIVAGIVAGMFVSKHLKYTDALEMLEDGKIEDAIEVHQELGDYKDLAAEICAAAQEQCKKLLKKESYSKVEKLYAAVEGYPDALTEMDQLLEKHLKDLLKDGAFETVLEAYDAFEDNEAATETIEKKLGEAMAEYLEKDMDSAAALYRTLQENDLEPEPVNGAIYDYACGLMENGEYDAAQGFFELLDGYRDSTEKLQEIQFAWAMTDLKEYISYGWYDDAEALVNSWDGEEHQKLLEIYLAACGDSTFLADLEDALLARIAMALESDNYLEVANLEWEMLEKYQRMPFYDDRLGELAAEYLDALYEQRYAADYWYAYEYADYYEFIYSFQYYAGERYAVLDQLKQEYGFNPSSADIQGLFGIGENMKAYYNAWYEIHLNLEDYLWGIAPYKNADGQYCLDVYNYTDYTFSIYVTQSFHDSNDNVLAEYDAEYLNVEPYSEFQVIIGHPGSGVDYWYIDWEIYDIYLNGVLIDY